MPLLNLNPTKKKRPDGLDREVVTSTSTRSLLQSTRMGSSMSSILSIKSDKGNSEPESISQREWNKAQENLMSDSMQVRRAMDLFLNSKIPEAEAILEPNRHSSLYHALGHAFVLFLKSLMTFQHTDIEAAIEAIRETILMADSFRRKETGWVGSITSWVKGLTVQDFKNMSTLHRHAELIYAETHLLKALLCIIHDESFVSFLREGLHVRTSYNAYRVLHRFVQTMEEEQVALDDHFTSGVYLGVGLFHIMISLLPSSVLRLVEFIGFTNDRALGLATLEKVGGWDRQPLRIQGKDEGLRRQFCDMSLLLYHVILSKLIPLSDVSDSLAHRVLDYNLSLYPEGVFFLYFSGKQLSAEGDLAQARAQFQKAIDKQKDWKQLQHVCYWELGLVGLLEHHWSDAKEVYTILFHESNWSKAVYLYLKAVAIAMLGEWEEAGKLMKNVTEAKQKIAGKSIPLEKFIARKSRKFLLQENRLCLPDLEALAAFNSLDFMNNALVLKNLDRVQHALDTLDRKSLYYYDDLCLAHYLRLNLLRLLITREQGDRQHWETLHEVSLTAILDHAHSIQLDHYLYYFARYEQARLHILHAQYDQAKEIVKSIVKTSEKGLFNVGAGPHAKNKYSLESTLLFKCHNCLTEIDSLSGAQ
ncbi:hypothetical protein BY458DRAFT_498061 [Sporodiniella umbellata]|nr:hypothetical protein BY458DRAFT_498061 [Sporodiniella umbellata]